LKLNDDDDDDGLAADVDLFGTRMQIELSEVVCDIVAEIYNKSWCQESPTGRFPDGMFPRQDISLTKTFHRLQVIP